MKKVIGLILFALSFNLQAQDTTTVDFALDTIRFDSFFLQITYTYNLANKERDDVKTEDIYFNDTTSFNSYIDALKQRLTDLIAQKTQIGIEYQSISEQVTKIEALRDSVFRGMDIAITAIPFSADINTRNSNTCKMAGILHRRKKRKRR